MASKNSNLRLGRRLRQFLSSPEGKALALTALVVLTAGCSGLMGSDGGGQGTPLDDIPEGVDVVMHFESGVLEDPTTEELMNGLIDLDTGQAGEMGEDQPENWEEVLQQFEEETDLRVSGFHSMTVFGKSSGLSAATEGMGENSQGMNSDQQDYAGVIMQTDYTWQEMVEAADQNPDSFSEETYNGVTVYVNESVENMEQVDQSGWVADMGEGKYVLGPKNVVQDVIDTNQGNMASFSGDIRQAYESAPDGYMKMAANVTDDATQAASSAAGGGMMMGASSLQGAEIMTMSYHTGMDTMTFEMEMQMASAEQAQEIADLQSLLTMSASGEESPSPGESPAAWAAQTLEFEQDGNTVTMSFSASPAEILDLFEGMNEQQSSGTDFSLVTQQQAG